MNFGPLKSLFKIISLLAMVIIYIPIFGVLVGSFINLSPVDNTYVLSLEGYIRAFTNSELLLALNNSLIIAAICSVLTTIFAITLSYTLQTQNKKILQKLRQLFYLPMLLPEIVIGISLLIWFVIIHFSLGKISLVVSHVTFALPYAVILLTLGLEGIDNSLIEAARDLGANHNQIFTKLTLPLLKPTLLGIFLLSFVISFDDFLISYFTAGAGNDTLPIKLYALMRYGLSNELKAVSSIILVSSVALTGLLIKILLTSLEKNKRKTATTGF